MSSIFHVFYSASMDDSSLLFLYICFSVSPFFCFSVLSVTVICIHDLEPFVFRILCFLFLFPSALAFVLFFFFCVSLSLFSEFYCMLFCLSASLSLSLSLFVLRFTCSLQITLLHKHKTF